MATLSQKTNRQRKELLQTWLLKSDSHFVLLYFPNWFDFLLSVFESLRIYFHSLPYRKKSLVNINYIGNKCSLKVIVEEDHVHTLASNCQYGWWSRRNTKDIQTKFQIVPAGYGNSHHLSRQWGDRWISMSLKMVWPPQTVSG